MSACFLIDFHSRINIGKARWAAQSVGMGRGGLTERFLPPWNFLAKVIIADSYII